MYHIEIEKLTQLRDVTVVFVKWLFIVIEHLYDVFMLPPDHMMALHSGMGF